MHKKFDIIKKIVLSYRNDYFIPRSENSYKNVSNQFGSSIMKQFFMRNRDHTNNRSNHKTPRAESPFRRIMNENSNGDKLKRYSEKFMSVI